MTAFAIVDVDDVLSLVVGGVEGRVAGVVVGGALVELDDTAALLAGTCDAVPADGSSLEQAAARHSNVAATTDLIARTVVGAHSNV